MECATERKAQTECRTANDERYVRLAGLPPDSTGEHGMQIDLGAA